MDMKKTFKFFAAALAFVAAVSCAKESTDNSVNSEVETVPVILTASYDAQTKTLLGADNWVNWSDNDAIRVAYADSYGDVYLHDGIFTIDPSSNDNDPTFAAFSGNLPTNKAKKFSAIFPGQGWEGTSDGVRFSGLSTQQAVVGSFDPAKHIAISEVTKGTHFTFQNACSLLKVTIGSDGVYSIKVDGTSNEIGIGKPFQYKLGTMDILKFQDWAGYDASITLSNTDSTPLLNGGTYYIVVPHVTVKNFKVSLCDASGSVLYSQSKKSDFAIVRNKIYDLGTMTVPEKPVLPDPQIGDFFYSDGSYSAEFDSSRTVVGVVFYVGNPTEDDTTLKTDFPNCVNGLVVGLSQSSGTEIFGENNVTWESTDFMSTIGVEYRSGSIIPREPGASLKTGYNNTAAFRAKDSAAFALTYCSNMPSVTVASTWFIPTVAEFDAMYESLAVINNSIETASGTKLSGFYSTASQEYMYPTYIGKYNINEKRLGEQTKRQSGVVRPIFAF